MTNESLFYTMVESSLQEFSFICLKTFWKSFIKFWIVFWTCLLSGSGWIIYIKIYDIVILTADGIIASFPS